MALETPSKPERKPGDPLTPLDQLAPRDAGWRSPLEPSTPGRTLSGGASIADFELMEKLGKGNCGTVHKGEQPRVCLGGVGLGVGRVPQQLAVVWRPSPVIMDLKI